MFILQYGQDKNFQAKQIETGFSSAEENS